MLLLKKRAGKVHYATMSGSVSNKGHMSAVGMGGIFLHPCSPEKEKSVERMGGKKGGGKIL